MSAPAYKRFLDKLGEIIDELKKEEAENLLAAAEKMADCIENDHMIHLWGPGGHSAIVAEDALYRKGGLACVNPIYDPTMSLSHGALQEINHFEGMTGFASALLDYYGVEKDDVFIISNAFGASAGGVDLALEVKRRGLFLIAISSAEAKKYYIKGHPLMHESELVVPEIADITISNHCIHGDGLVEIEGVEVRVAPVSTIMQSVVYQTLVAQTAELLVERGVNPPIWVNAFDAGGIEKNQEYIDKYAWRVKCL